MKISGTNLKISTATLQLPKREFSLKVAALPIGTDYRFAELWPEPRVPTKTVKGAGGKTETVYLHDREDHVLEKHKRLVGQKAFYFREALRYEDRITWDVESLSSRADVENFIEEMRESTFTNDEVMLVYLAANELSGDTDKEDITELFV